MQILLISTIFILLIGGEVTLKSCLGYQHRDLVAPPEIRVTKWISEADVDYIDETWDLEWNEKIDTDAIKASEFGSPEYVVSQHVAAMIIECSAQYPVEWEFHNAYYVTEDLHGIELKTFRRSKSVKDSTGDVFSTTLEISMESNRATGNYSCRSAQDPFLSRDVYIFWEGSSQPSDLVLSGRVVEIDVDLGTNFIILPCYVSSPSVTVQLFKEVGGEFKLVAVPPNLYFKFDPKIGFELFFHNISDIIGRYRCLSGDDDSEVLEAHVRKGDGGGCINGNCFHRQVSSGTSFYFNEKSEELVCCGRSGQKAPRLHTIFCSNPSVCRMYEEALNMAGGNSGKRSLNGSCVSERLYPRDFGLVKCKGDGIDVFTYVYTEFWTLEQENLRAVFDWKQLNPQNMVHVMIHAPSPFYKNQMVTATCQTLHSYFSDGIKWAIKWKNGSIHYFDSILSTETDPRLHGIRSTYLRLSSSMSELVCYAPQWNSTQWVEKSFKLDVKPSRSPMIDGNVIEELTFSLNDTEKILECVSNADPPAKIKWTRNDEDVPREMVIWNQNGTSGLMFKTVSYNNIATYKCIAKNEVGQARKVFRVFVEDTRHSSWSTAFAVVIPLLVIALLGIFAFFMWKMQLQKKVVDHLTRVVFRESN